MKNRFFFIVFRHFTLYFKLITSITKLKKVASKNLTQTCNAVKRGYFFKSRPNKSANWSSFFVGPNGILWVGELLFTFWVDYLLACVAKPLRKFSATSYYLANGIFVERTKREVALYVLVCNIKKFITFHIKWDDILLKEASLIKIYY